MPLPQGYILDSQGQQGGTLPQGFILDNKDSQSNPSEPFSVKAQRAMIGGTGNEPVGQQLMTDMRDIPRQLGLTGRYIMEGMTAVPDLLMSRVKNYRSLPISDDLRQQLLKNSSAPENTGKAAADYIGLPSPQTPVERNVGDISTIIAGSAFPIGVAGMAAKGLTGTGQAIAKSIAARPDIQLQSSIGSGIAGSYAKEQGGGPVEQFMASLIGGLAVPGMVAGARAASGAIGNMADKAMGSPQQSANLDKIIDLAASQNGVNTGNLSDSIRNSLRSDIIKARQTGELTPDVVRRLVDYRLTGLTPTSGPLSLDPGIITRQKNLANLGASSSDPSLQALSQITAQNNRKLIENVNQLGANSPTDIRAAGQKVMDSLDILNEAKKSDINSLYSKARDSAGRSARLDPSVFTQNANNALDDALLGGKLPSDVRNLMNNIAQANMPFTVDVAEQLKTRIGELQRATNDMAERKALGIVRSSLDNAPLLDQEGNTAIGAFNAARMANRHWMEIVDKTPALQAVRDGVEPDKFMQKYISSSPVNDVFNLKQTINQFPQATDAVRSYIAQSLKNAALGSKSEEVGIFSSSNYSKALNSIGDAKLSMFFSPQEVQALKAIGRVASYEQAQPAGSAVNNSKTAAAAIATVLDRIGDNSLSRKITLGMGPTLARMVSGPMRSASQSQEARQMFNIPTSVGKLNTSEPVFMLPPILAPYLLQND